MPTFSGSAPTPKDVQTVVEPSFSIAIPTYNRASGYLENCLKSALSQTCSDNLEVVVCDNASEDHTSALVEGFQSQFPNLRYIRHPENIGANANFNACLQAASGDFVLLLHDDDAISSGFTEACRTAIIRSGCDFNAIGIVRTGCQTIDQTGESINRHPVLKYSEGPIQSVSGWLNGDYVMYLANTLFNTAALQAVGGFNSPTNLMQDIVANLRIMARYQTIEVPDVLASLRIHDEEISHGVSVKAWCEDTEFVRQTFVTEYGAFEDFLATKQALDLKLENMAYRRCTETDSFRERIARYREASALLNAKRSPVRYELERFSRRVSRKLGGKMGGKMGSDAA